MSTHSVRRTRTEEVLYVDCVECPAGTDVDMDFDYHVGSLAEHAITKHNERFHAPREEPRPEPVKGQLEGDAHG